MQRDDKFKALDRHITKAIATIVHHMTNEDTAPQVQLRACQIYLELSLKYNRMAELEEQVRAVELLFAAQDGMPLERDETGENGDDYEDEEADGEEQW